ncbi:MAG: hypothetical protein K8T25_05530 [Planctomycetia bacterium]|nr:hypothetical protein [Planctomycetia bacterium]
MPLRWPIQPVVWMLLPATLAGCAHVLPPPPPYPTANGQPPTIAGQPAEVYAPPAAPTAGVPLPLPGAPVIVPTGVARIPNPLHVPATNSETFWELLVDVIDTDFRISKEERIRQVGDVLTEGRIDTYPRTGSTILEPWRGDSVGYAQKLEATLQTIRRRAQVRVIPEAGGFLVEITVEKELENLSHPEQATAASSSGDLGESNDRRTSPLGKGPVTIGWIPRGRDVALEQTLLAELMTRLGMTQPGAAPGPRVY